jgi:hypothetical protein
MTEPKRRISKLQQIGAIASIICLIIAVITIVFNPGGIIPKGVSVKIEGLNEFYSQDYDEDLTFEITLLNDGGERLTISSIGIIEILWGERDARYETIYFYSQELKIKTGSEMNINVTIPARQARGTTVFKLEVEYNGYNSKDSEMFEVHWR